MFGEWGEEVEADEFLVKINAFVVSRFISIIFCVLSLCVSQPGFKDYALLNYVSSFVFLFIRTNLIFNLVGEYFLIRSPTLIVPGCWGVCASWLYYIQWSCFFFMIYESFVFSNVVFHFLEEKHKWKCAAWILDGLLANPHV